MTNILITGGSGFVGSHLANFLSLNPDNTIFSLTRNIKKESTFNALKLSNKKNINLLIGDITNQSTITEMLIDNKIDQVYHTAAKSIVQNANLLPYQTYNTNILGTVLVLESVRNAIKFLNKEISVLVTSSDKAYGTSPILPYTEDMPLNGLDIYSSSKACQDILARTFAYNYNIPVVVSRACNIIGEYDFNWSRAIPQFIKAYLTNSQIIIYEKTMHQVREYIYIYELVKALTILMDNIEKTKGQAYNITSGYTLTVSEIIESFQEVTKYENIKYIKDDKPFKEIKEQTLDGSKFKSISDWTPDMYLDDKLFERIIKDYKEYLQ